MICPLRRLIAACGIWLLAVCASAQDKPQAWAEKDTRLASEYLNLLVEKPEYGRVLGLLWELYDKHQSSALLLDAIAAQAKTQSSPNVMLVHAHVLRKAGRLKDAQALYENVLRGDGKNVIALRALADLSIEQSKRAEALGYLDRIADTFAPDDPQRAPLLMEKGRLALEANKSTEAVAAWDAAVKLQPGNAALVREVAQLYLGSGFLDKALAIYRELAKSADPVRRLDALYDLSRIEEQGDHVKEACDALREGMGTLHFRDWRYHQFFTRLVKLHERFGQLDVLKNELLKATQTQPPSEKSLADMAEFSELTVDADARIKWLRELVRNFPEAADYRWQLAGLLIDHDGWKEAGEQLDKTIKNDGSDPPALLLLRALVDLRSGDEEKASGLLKDMLQKLVAHGANPDVEKQVLAFAREKSLDDVTEMILKARVERDPDKAEAVMELAGFYRARQKSQELQNLLDHFASSAGTQKEKRDRLNQVAIFLAGSGDAPAAEKAAREAAQQPGAGRDEILRLADVLSQDHPVDEVLPLLERAWNASDTPEKRTDVDERILAILSGETIVKKPAPVETKGEFKLPALFTGEGFGSEAPADKGPRTPQAVVDYAAAQTAAVELASWRGPLPRIGLPPVVASALRNVFSTFTHGVRPPAPERILRAAWWCFRSEQNDAAGRLLWKLATDAQGHAVKPPLEAEKLWLDIALSEGNTLLAERQLRLLSVIDPAGRASYQMRLAEQEMTREGQNDPSGPGWMPVPARQGSSRSGGAGRPEATRILEALVKDDPQNVSALTALAQCYMVDRQPDKALALWEKAVHDARGNAAPLLERYAEALVTQRKFKEFIGTQAQLLEDETDLKRRRENFQRALERLMWADSTQGEITEAERKSRLDLAAGVLRERARRHPFDGFWHEALAQVLDRQGDAAKSFDEMKRAYYTAPDTPFSLDQLRAAALRVNDLKSAIYFQKQIAAAAPAKEAAGEWQELVQLLEQDFRIGEADQVRRRLESRLSQDPAALEDLAKFYSESSQDDAARRVLAQIARVQPWEQKNLLRLALAQENTGARDEARRTLLALLKGAPPKADQDSKIPVERLPWPLLDERRTSPATRAALQAAIDNAPGIDPPERDALRVFMSLPRDELTELPDEPTHVRLRAIEELAKLDRGSALGLQLADPVERAWALFYGGGGKDFTTHLDPLFVRSDSAVARFVYVWLCLRAHAMEQTVAWARADEPADARWPRKMVLRFAAEVLAEVPGFAFTRQDLEILGDAHLLTGNDLIDIATKLENRQHHELGLVLREALARQMNDPGDDVLLALGQRARLAGREDLFQDYMQRIWNRPLVSAPAKLGQPVARGSGPQADDPQAELQWQWRLVAQSVEAATPRANDPFIYSLDALLRTARTPEDRARLVSESWRRIHQVAPSGLNTLREACVMVLAGADDAGAARLGSYLGGGYLAARPFVEPLLGRLPPGIVPGPRIDEVNHLRGYWEDVRECGAVLRSLGLGRAVNAADTRVNQRDGGTRSGTDFNTWRTHMLARRMQAADYPERIRLLREHLAADDSVDVMIELGSFLESQGFTRECIEVYRRLPSRAPSNAEYADDLVRASNAAWDFTAVMPYLEHLFDPAVDPVFKPLTLPFETLRRDHAKFLAMMHDKLALRVLGFKAGPVVKMGRIPEEVPYLRELGLLLEKEGDRPGALAAWEQMARLWPDDAQGTLHRAQLLVAEGNAARALDLLRKMPQTSLWDANEREALELRARLAADAGLRDELRELMNLAASPPAAAPGGAHQVNTDAVLALARILADHQQTSDAQSLLIRAERGTKDGSERFRLRLEQLEIASRDPMWKPQNDAARLGALLRVEIGDERPLKELRDWMTREAQTPRAKAWFDLLDKSPPNVNTALALAALGRAQDAQGAHYAREEWKARSPLLGEAVRLTAGCLMDHRQPALALEIVERRSPLGVRALAALNDETGLREVFSEIVRMNIPGGGETVEFAEAFASVGRTGLADEIYSLALARVRGMLMPLPPLVKSYAKFLVTQKRFEEAETLLIHENAGLTGGLPEILVALYQGWGRLGRIKAELPKFHLPGAVQAETEHLAARATQVK